MTEVGIVIAMFLAFLITLFLGTPLVFVLGGISIIFGFLFWGDANIVSLFVRTTTKLATTTSYVCIPLFIIMGAALEKSGAAAELFESIHVMTGRVRGGLAIATVLICALMGASTGVIGASITIMGMMALPAMLKAGYSKTLASGVVMAGGSLGSLIPPSVILVVYAGLSSLSISKLFAGGMGAGLFLALLYIIYIVVLSILKPEVAPPISKEQIEDIDKVEQRRMFLGSFLPTIILIVAVLGSIMSGIATPNEASAVGALGAFILAAFKKKLNKDMILDCCFTSIKSTSMVVWIILTASMFTSVFLGLGGGRVVTDLIMNLGGGNRWIIFTIILFLIAIMGMLIDSTGVLMIGVPLFTPILYPLGFDPLWFGIIFATMIQVSYLSPPFAYGIFYLKAVAPPEITTEVLYKAVIPFMLIMFIGIVFMCFFPQIITFLPSIVK